MSQILTQEPQLLGVYSEFAKERYNTCKSFLE